MARLVRTPFGRPALEALAGVVGEAQGGDPLAPVTVVVPSAPASVSVRRALGRRSATGVANVRTLALPQLAELLATPGSAAAQRVPLTPTRAAATIRAGWREAKAPLSQVSPSAPLEEALLQTFARLRDASDAELRALERTSARASAVIDRFRDHRERIADRIDRHDLLALATDAVRAGAEVLAEVGAVVVYLPRRLGRSDLALLEALDARSPVVVVLGVTGDDDGDRPLRRLVQQLGSDADGTDPALPEPPDARIVLAPDPDEEAREAVRAVLDHLAAGVVDLDRIAVVSRVESPYRLLLHEHLDAAGLDHHVDLPWSVAQSLPGRVLLGLLDLPDHEFRRVELARWLRSGPLRWRGQAVPASRWDKVARRAGVVQGLEQWRDRLDRYRDELVEYAERDGDDQERIERRQRRLAEVDAVQAFVHDLSSQLPTGRRQSWAEWTTWAGERLDELLGSDTERTAWHEDDEADLRFVQQALDALGELDEVEEAPDVNRFRRVLADELGRQRRRVGHLGRGVQVGDLESVYGQDLDLVVIVGMAEGWYPPRRRDDPLLPDHELADAGLGDALGRPDRSDDRRDHLAARVAGTTVVLTAPRSDPRGQRELQPARWLLDELSLRAGRRIGLADVAGLEVPWLRRSPSFEDTVRTASTAIEAGERDLTALLRSTVSGAPEFEDHPAVRADGRLHRGLDAVAARRDRRYGEWTGDIGPREELRFRDEAVPSATRLERFALCPFQYLLDSVLHVHAHDDPVDVEGITPRDRGSLVHEVLETFLGEQLGRAPDAPWTDEERRRLEAVLDEVGERYRARGMTGRDLGWELQSAAIRRWLGAVLDRDDDERSAWGMSPAAVELMFGDDEGEHPPAEVGLPDGRRLHFRGMVDRIDRAADGSLLVVDYKTGKGTSYRPVDEDRLDRGRRLQLPIYADAARRAFPGDTEPARVDAYYWFVEESGRKAWRGGPVDEAVQERFESVVGTIVDGIESGKFPANPGDESYFGPTHCGFCDFQRVCPSSRVDLWEGVREDAALDEYRELAEESSVSLTLEPTDQAARERIRTDHDATLFVEAGAGTGKTTALVRRVAELVVTGRVTSARQLAAITFTEAAAAELRDRVREQLEEEVGRMERTDEERARVESVLADVDEITLTTLHGFASRLLGEFPLEAGLPPGFEVEDEIEASVRFDRRWRDLLDDLHQDPELRPVLARGISLRLPLSRLAEVAAIFDDNWDRLGDEEVDPVLAPVSIDGVVTPLVAAVERAGSCIDPEDKLLTHLEDVAAPMAHELAALDALGDADTLLTALVRSEKLSCSNGKQDLWNGAKPEVVAALGAAEEERTRLIHDHRSEVLTILAARLRTFAAEGAEDRRRRGQVSYHDLLVHARDLLHADAGVRTALAGRYQYLLIDEFQDTDPLQIEIAALLAAARPGEEPGHWTEIDVVPGKLFFVGDPKQSIYRFRRADIALYSQAQTAFEADPVRLTANFRSVPDVLSWVNRVFGELIVDDGDAQPPYIDLDPHRAAPGARPAVQVVGGPVEGKSIGEIREAEADELAELVQRMRAEAWEVGREERRPLRYDDVALLVPTRTPLGQIERELERHGVPYRIESRSLIFQTDEVRELLAILAAVDDPADEVAVVAALRSPGLACSDAELADWRLAGGTWDPGRTAPEGWEEHPVAVALSDLAVLHEERDWLPVNELVAKVIRQRRLVELTLARRRPRDHWRRYRFLADAARAFVEAGGTSLAEFVAWVTAQADGRADRIETVAREADDDAVRIMTVHGSKGLEFPVVVLAGLNADRDVRAPLVSWSEVGPEIRFGSRVNGYFETSGYSAVRASDERFEEAEQRRLLYVAATRAQDHLVVSLHHKPANQPSHAQLLHGICVDCTGLHTQPEAAQLALAVEPPRPGEPVEADDAAARWREDRTALLARVRAAGVATPSGLAHQDETPVAEQDRRVPGRGEGGTARGRAVHAVLQAVHLPDAADLDELAALEAAQEGLAERVEEVATVARAALAAPVVQRALGSPRFWRELAVVADVGGRLVEGFIDLAFEDEDGHLVVVDYKTDAVRSAAEVDAAADRYRVQIAAYAAALAAATGRAVVEGWLVFAGLDGAQERSVDLVEALGALEVELKR